MPIQCTLSPPFQSIFIPNLTLSNIKLNSPIFSEGNGTKPTKRTRTRTLFFISLPKLSLKILGKETRSCPSVNLTKVEVVKKTRRLEGQFLFVSVFLFSSLTWLTPVQVAQASVYLRTTDVYDFRKMFETGIQLSYLLILLALLGVGSFYVFRQVLVRRELDLSAKELQEQVRSGDASATELFELGAVMLRRKVYSAATKYLLKAINKWDGNDQDLAQVYNALGVSYILDVKVEKGISAFENAVKLQPAYVTAWTNLGDAYEKNEDLKSAIKAFEEVLVYDPENKVALPRRDALKEKVAMYRGVSVKQMKK